MISYLLVAAQIGLILLLLATTRLPGAAPVAGTVALLLVVLAAIVGLAALAANRPGNFNIQPEVKHGARLITHGIYARVRHPMYLAVLLGMLGFIVADPRAWRAGAWVALLAVLLAKASREEGNLAARFPEYTQYRARTPRLLPRLW